METRKRTLYLMGTVIQMWLQHESPKELLDEAEAMLREYEQRFSANREDSELMKINRNAGISPVRTAPDLFELIEIGRAHSLAEDSFLNIAVGPLIQAWRIGFNDARQPAETEIEQLLKQVAPENIELNDQKKTVFLTQKEMAIDLGSLAKGYFADQIIAYFQEKRAAAAFIDLGGNVLTFGEAPNRADGYWRIGIQNPFLPRGNYVAVVKVKNQSVVTSGIYERKLEKDGQTFHHIFDSRTGYPVNTNVASITIVSDRSLDGEIWTTRLYGKKAEEIIVTLNAMQGIGGAVIITEGELAYTEDIKKQME